MKHGQVDYTQREPLETTLIISAPRTVQHPPPQLSTAKPLLSTHIGDRRPQGGFSELIP